MLIRIMKISPKLLIQNFGLTALSMIAFGCYMSILIMIKPDELHGVTFRLMQFFILLPFFSLNSDLLGNSLKLKPIKKLILNLFAVIFTFISIFLIFPANDFNVNNNVRYKSFSLIFTLLIASLVIPYFRKGNNNEFWNYLKRIVFNGTIIFTFFEIAFVGLCLAFVVIDSLLGLHIGDTIYQLLLIWIALVWPIIFLLGNYPLDFNNPIKPETYPKLFKVLATYILIPLVTIYTIILYGYGIKLLVTGEWPENQTVYLILGLIFPGCLGILLLYPYKYFSNSKLFNNYRRLFGLSILPIMVIYFYSIGIRINEYGFTVDRLYVVIFGLWVMLSAIYLFVSDPKLKNIFGLLAVLLLLGSFFPYFNIFTLSEKSQFKRLETILTPEIRNEGIELKSTEYSQSLDIIRYLHQNHDLESLRPWFTDEKWNSLDLEGEFTYEIPNTILEALGVKNEEGETLYGTPTRYVQGKINLDEIEIDGFNKMKEFEFEGFGKSDHVIVKFGINEYVLYFDTSVDRFKLNGDKGEIEVGNSLQPIVNKAVDMYTFEYEPEEGTLDYFFSESSSTIKFRIVITEFSGNVDSNSNNLDVSSVKGIVLY